MDQEQNIKKEKEGNISRDWDDSNDIIIIPISPLHHPPAPADALDLNF